MSIIQQKSSKGRICLKSTGRHFIKKLEREKTLKSDFKIKILILAVGSFWSSHISETLRATESSFSKEFSRKNCIQIGLEIKKSCNLGVDPFCPLLSLKP